MLNFAVEAPADRPRTVVELADLLPDTGWIPLTDEGYYAYFGTYDVNEGAATVTHHVQGSMRPFEIGRDYRRPVRLVDDRLILSLSETRSLTWRRLQ